MPGAKQDPGRGGKESDMGARLRFMLTVYRNGEGADKVLSCAGGLLQLVVHRPCTNGWETNQGTWTHPGTENGFLNSSYMCGAMGLSLKAETCPSQFCIDMLVLLLILHKCKQILPLPTPPSLSNGCNQT